MPDVSISVARYRVGELLYINDSFTTVSRRVTRVKIVGLYFYGGVKRYMCVLVKHAGRSNYIEVGPSRVIREEVLSREPRFRRAGPGAIAQRMMTYQQRKAALSKCNSRA